MADLFMERHESDAGSWEYARRAPARSLFDYVIRYTGYREDLVGTMLRRELPTAGFVVGISLEDTLGITSPNSESPSMSTFLAGLHTGPALTSQTGLQRGLQIELTPEGARTLLDIPLDQLANRSVEVSVVDVTVETRLRDIAETPGSWADRFDLLDEYLQGVFNDTPRSRDEVTWAWKTIRRTDGNVSIDEVAHDVGWSRRHLARRFRRDIGLVPKELARLVRFHRATRMMVNGVALAEVALRCGYSDQAHLNREFRTFAGITPTEYLTSLATDPTGQ